MTDIERKQSHYYLLRLVTLYPIVGKKLVCIDRDDRYLPVAYCQYKLHDFDIKQDPIEAQQSRFKLQLSINRSNMKANIAPPLMSDLILK